MKKQRKESSTGKNNINKSDMSIRDIIDNSFIKDYQKYIEYLERNKWIRESIKIGEYNSALVTANTLCARNEGVIIGIRCPPGMIFSIMGKDSFPIGYRENIHPFELKLANADDIEIDPDTEIRIYKDKLFKKRVEICSIKYMDINMINYSDTPNLFKKYSELYRFDQGIEFKGEENLRVYVINPDIDINIIKFNLGIHLWTQYEENMMR